MKGLTICQQLIPAWIKGRKTITRRLIGKPRIACIWCKGFGYEFIAVEGEPGLSGYDYRQPCRCIKPRYLPGETVYIKETWIPGYEFEEYDEGEVDEEYGTFDRVEINYKADGFSKMCLAPVGTAEKYLRKYGREDGCDTFPDLSPRIMPEWASRSHALIVSVRPEKIQSITTRECVREGMVCGSILDDNSEDVLRTVRESKSCLIAAALLKTSGAPPRKQFQSLWESLHKGSWQENSWVWRIELEKVS